MTDLEIKQLLELLDKAWSENKLEIGYGGEGGSPSNIELDSNGVIQIYST